MKVTPFSFTDLANDTEESAPVTNTPFSSFTNPNVKETIEVSFTAKQLEESEQEGYQRGHNDGINEGRKESYELNQRLDDTINKITPHIENLFNQYINFIENSTKETTNLALEIAKKIAGDAIKDDPMPTIEKTVEKCLPFLFNEPKISVIVNPELEEKLNNKITIIVSNTNFEGDINIVSDPNIGLGDCKVKWQDGGAEISREKQIQRIEEIINSINN